MLGEPRFGLPFSLGPQMVRRWREGGSGFRTTSTRKTCQALGGQRCIAQTGRARGTQAEGTRSNGGGEELPEDKRRAANGSRRDRLLSGLEELSSSRQKLFGRGTRCPKYFHQLKRTAVAFLRFEEKSHVFTFPAESSSRSIFHNQEPR